MNINATVQAETSDLPGATFQIKTILPRPWAAGQTSCVLTFIHYNLMTHGNTSENVAGHDLNPSLFFYVNETLQMMQTSRRFGRLSPSLYKLRTGETGSIMFPAFIYRLSHFPPYQLLWISLHRVKDLTLKAYLPRVAVISTNPPKGFGRKWK
jgi:hypothetical protein